ncbi:hypothetical protein pVco7_gp100 [Vibrio phage pVco-7]|uniref:PD-(D/E)XK endonuclease-like domain-containing protein n=1 Tax=Vibrio phage pVco-5 TaxID=1965485 RepID=A0A1W6JUY6_9CAUD|nr:exonuclease [Vibrio phage pVco-5]ARM71088.1 hypothetical protein pVco5_100 [Vibrio phage pVco-5]
MNSLKNDSNIPLSVAVYLASSSYDFKPNPKALSATDFNRSVRQIILRNRVNGGELANEPKDIANLVKSKNGTAIHDAIEKTWLDTAVRSAALKALGYPAKVIERIVVNPEPGFLEMNPDAIPIYMEIRNSMELDGYTISGKFDFVGEGGLTDFKSTGTWKYKDLEKADKDYRTQGSIYKVLNPDIIEKDHMTIVFWFTDWMESRAKADPKYPQTAVIPHKVKLMDEADTIRFMRSFIAEIEKYKDVPESELPECSAEHLWQGEPTYKYYKNPQKRSRATANFTDFAEAQTRFIKDGAIGVVVTVPAKAKACKYCNAYDACSQKDRLIQAGLLDTD